MRALRLFAAAAATAAVTGCVNAAAHTSSPWQFGGGVRAAPGFAIGQRGLTAHPMASYTYLSFDGGYDDLFEFGAQVRRPLARGNRSAALWVGGEAAFSVMRTHVDNIAGTFNTNGWSLTGLAGMPVGTSKWGVSLYTGAGLSHYGSMGFNLRLGVDLQPWFLKPANSRSAP